MSTASIRSGLRRSQLRLLLLQVREDCETKAEEFEAFVSLSHLEAGQVKVLDAFRTPFFQAPILDAFDGLLIGGSSDASVLKPDIFPFIGPSEALLAYAVEQAIPVFASCFGFQLLVQALKGMIICDRPNLEMGVYPIHLTEAAQNDILMHDLPQQFWAVSGHQERASCLPDTLINLAYSQRCPFHAIKVPGKPIYGFQFHPEVNQVDLTSRLYRYRDRYLDDAAEVEHILNSLRETPESNQLIGKFVDRILLAS